MKFKATNIKRKPQSLQNLCLLNISKAGNFSELIYNYDNNNVSKKDEILYNLFSHILSQQDFSLNKDYIINTSIKNQIKYGLNSRNKFTFC